MPVTPTVLRKAYRCHRDQASDEIKNARNAAISAERHFVERAHRRTPTRMSGKANPGISSCLTSALSHREQTMPLHSRVLAPTILGSSVSLAVGLLFALGGCSMMRRARFDIPDAQP